MAYSNLLARFAPPMLLCASLLATAAIPWSPANAYVIFPGVAAADVTVVTVATKTELKAAVQAASGPTEIRMLPGNYGSIYILNTAPAHDIVIRSAQSNNRAVITRLVVRNASRLRFEALNFDLTLQPGQPTWTLGAELTRTHDVSISNCNFLGSQNDNPNDDGRLLFVSRSQNVLLFNNYFSEGSMALAVRLSTQTHVVANKFRMLREGVNVEASNDSLFDRNYFSHIIPWEAAGDHADALQVYVGTLGPVTNRLHIENNAFILDRGTAQAIFISNPRGAERHNDLKFRNNVIYNRVAQGIWLQDVNGVDIDRNTLVTAPDPIYDPRIYLRRASDVVIAGNIAPITMISTDATAAQARNIDLADAYHRDGLDPSSQLTGDVTVNDPLLRAFRVRRNSEAGRAPAGARLPAGVGGVRGTAAVKEAAYQAERVRLGASAGGSL